MKRAKAVCITFAIVGASCCEYCLAEAYSLCFEIVNFMDQQTASDNYGVEHRLFSD